MSKELTIIRKKNRCDPFFIPRNPLLFRQLFWVKKDIISLSEEVEAASLWCHPESDLFCHPERSEGSQTIAGILRP
jgi:hypothetical protein